MKRIFSIIFCIIVMISSLTVVSFAEKSEEKVTVKSKSCALMDVSQRKLLLGKNEHERLYPASVTKIMTLLLVIESIDNGKINLTDNVTASTAAAGKGGSQIWLKEGETMTVDELLRASAIGSANDACTALAEYIAGSEEGFVRMMNDRAAELGMKDTHFENCTGLDDDTTDHMTTAYDIALMSCELLKHERIMNYTTVWMDKLRDGATELVNTNKLVRFYKGTTGLKTGTTSKAGHCVSASAMRNGLHLVAVVLGAENSTDRFEGAKSLLNWGFANYETVTPKVEEGLITDVTVLKGIYNKITPELETILPMTLESGKSAKLETKIDLAVNVEAPVEKGQLLGTVSFMIGDEKVASYSLTAPCAVRKITLFDVMKRLIASLSIRCTIEETDDIKPEEKQTDISTAENVATGETTATGNTVKEKTH